MSSDQHDPRAQLAAVVRDIWNQNAEFWDARMGEGNDFHKRLIEPSQLELLELRGGEYVLDLACGNGQFARKMVEQGARVLGVDVADQLIARAQARSSELTDRLEFRVVDCTDEAALLALGESTFDAATCTMALMDISEIEPLVRAAARLLKPGGAFVFSLLHPCFNSGDVKQGVEQHDLGGTWVEEPYVRIVGYGRAQTHLGLAMQGQPAAQYYFHRPLAQLFGTFFAAGFVLDGMIEPTFGRRENKTRVFDKVFAEIPPALAGRMRRR